MLTVRGLNMALGAQYTKIYIGNASWRKDAVLTCTVKDTAETPAKGTVSFSTTQGSVSPGTCELNPAGTATTTLSPGNSAFVNTAYSTLGPITKSVQVTFADHTFTELQINPHKKTSEQAYAQAKLRDQDSQPFPGAVVNFNWQVPVNQEDTDSVTTPTGDPPPDAWVSSEGPPPTQPQWGTIQVTTSRIADPQCRLKFTAPENWTVSVLEGEGLTIKRDWESHGFKFGVSIDPTLKCALTATKSF